MIEKYGTAKEVIDKISDKYKYEKPKNKKYSKDDLLDELHNNNYKSKKEVIEYLLKIDDIDIDDTNYSAQGFLYERLWDICIKFGLVKNIIDFNNNDNKLLHFNDNGNINDIVISNCKEFKDFFDEYLNTNIQSGNSGGYSDITFRNKTEIVISSSKYFKEDMNKDIKKYELHNLCPIINKNTNTVKIILFLNDKKSFIKKAENANKSSQILIKYINPYGNYENVYDLNDLEVYFAELKNILNFYNYFKTDNDIKKFKENYLNHYKKIFEPKFHQHLFINQISKIIETNNKNKNILIGAIPRTGKTYILAGTINKYMDIKKQKEYNFIIITPAPTETIPQYNDVFNDYIDFEEINVITKDNKKKHKKDSKNVYIYSKQKLDCENKKCDKEEADIIKVQEKTIIQTLENHKFDIIFVDEAHYGMTTDSSKKLLDELNKQSNAFKIFITATYNKPIKTFEIPENQMLFWSLENVINLIKIANDDNKIKLFEKFIENIKKEKCFDIAIIDDVIKKIYKDNFHLILNQYKNFPQPYLLTTVWKNTDDIYNEIRLANGLDKRTFTMDTIFNLNKDNTFENENELIELFHYYYGYPRKTYIDENKNKYDINYDTRHKYKEYGIIPRIRNICENNCRTLQQPINLFNPTTQLWFLPTNDNKLSNKIPALLQLLKSNFKTIYNQTLFLISISNNEKITFNDDNIKYVKDKNEIKSKENVNREKTQYLNIVIITGFKFNLGVSFPNVDIVTLFNNSRSADLIYQMMFRSMTDINDYNDCLPNSSFCHKKKYGFIVDLNPQRTIEITNYIKSNIIKPTTKDKKLTDIDIQIKYMELLNVDRDFFKSKYDNDNEEIDIKNYTNEYFKKLNTYFKEAGDNIYNKLYNFIFDIDIKYINSIEKTLKDINIDDDDYKKTFKIKEGINEDFKKIKERIKKEYPQKTDEEIDKEVKKEYNNIEKIKILLSRLMVLLPIITDMNIKCVLDNSKYDIKLLKDELKRTLNIIKSNIKLHDIFIDFINDKCKFKLINNEFDEYYNFLIELINNLNKDSMSSSKSKSPIKEDIKKPKKEGNITKSLCNKWKNNMFINPITGRKMDINSVMYKKLKSKCPIIEGISEVKKRGRPSKVRKGGNAELMNYINDTMNTISTKLNNINNPKELLEFLNANLKPTKEKKEKNGEVFTPIKLIEEMMDKLTEAKPDIWSDPKLKWLDPAAGMGNFAVVVYLRLMEGLKKQMPNIEERKKHILENMLYMVEYDRTNSFMMGKIFCDNKYKLNIFTGSFIEGERYEKEGIDIFSLDESRIKKYKYKNYAEDNKRFSRNVKSFGGKFDIIMGNPPYNSGGILAYNQKKNTKERKVIWDEFINISFKLLKPSGYFLFINPLYWLKSTHKLHIFLLEKHIIWLLLWDDSQSKEIINGDIPLSIYLIHNVINKNKDITKIVTISKRRNINKISNIYLNKNYTIPLAYHNIYIKLLNYIITNNLQLKYYNKTIKSTGDQFKLPSKYHVHNMFAVDTYRIKEGILVKKALSIHPDLTKNKLIIANKSGFNGIFIDNGRLALTGNKKYYILGDNLELILKLLKFKIFNIICQFTKYEQHYLDSEVFKYIPDIRKLGIKDISEDEFYKLIKLTKEEIDEIKKFDIKTIEE